MSKDYRMYFLKEVENNLSNKFSLDDISIISNVIVKVLSEFEISERCTDIIVQDDENERLLKKYRACLLVDGKSEKTIYQYSRTIHKLYDKIKKPLPKMSAYDIRFFLALEQERGLTARTRENTRAYLSAFFQWMMIEEIIDKNPMLKIKPIKCNNEVKIPFSDIEVDALKGACKTLKERAIIEMLLSTGVRVSELSSMELQDINFNNLSVHVVHGKGQKERLTYTTSVSAKHLINYINARKEEGQVLFFNHTHEPLQAHGIRYIIKQISKRAGVNDAYPHRFRRTFACNLSRRGMKVHEIQKLLGHSNIDTTMEYIVIDDINVHESYRKYIV